MKTLTTTWLAQIVAVALILAAGSASASNGLLSGNSPLGKNCLEGGLHRASASVSGETHRGCVEVSRWDAAELFVAPSNALPPLRSIHAESSLSPTSLSYWRGRTNQQIIDSLRPGQAEALRVYPDGRIANGNTRISILRERGVNVDALPREPYIPDMSAFPNLPD
jgi:hypothetical protein